MEGMDQLAFFMQQHPIVNYFMMTMVASRLIFKPLFSILAKYIELSVEMDDNHRLRKFMQSKFYKLLCFTLDLTLSVKMVEIKKDK